MNPPLTLEWLPGRYAVCRLDSHAEIPRWALDSLQRAGASSPRLFCITRTDNELSIVCDESLIPPNAKKAMTIENDFAAMRIVGQVDMATIGIFAKLTAALADALVPVFAISTFDTDYLLVRSRFMAEATKALSRVAEFR
jgi:hypothetical protein